MIPSILLLLAAVASAAVVWGCDPRVAKDVATICVMHRLQWLLMAVSVASCMALAGLVALERHRAWWLLGLAPVLAAFGWRFGVQSDAGLLVEDQPVFASAAQSTWLGEEDRVIGLVIDGQAFAYPLAALGRTPLVMQSDRTGRVLLAWNAGSNAAGACWVDRSLRGRDLEIAAAPAGVLLIYNRRVGQFFDGLTFRTPQRGGARFLLDRVETVKTTWSSWRSRHPDTLVMQPRWPLGREPPRAGAASERVALLMTEPPVAVPGGSITVEPANLSSDRHSVLVFADAESGAVRAFHRRVDDDLFPRFRREWDRRHRRFVLVDSETQSRWDFTGHAIEGPMKGHRLVPIFVHDDVAWSAVKYWCSDAVLLR